jgi:glycosyltransferase involved in cell wall biosynthesis
MINPNIQHEGVLLMVSNVNFIESPLISILMPVYNTEESWLRSAIESVCAQSYTNWELCIAYDGSQRNIVKEVLIEYQEKDERIKVVFLNENKGISYASNQALNLCQGEFVGLLDHDDELITESLFEVVKLLNTNPEIDLIYTDEDKIDSNGKYIMPYFKPAFSPELLLGMNYINHFCVFRRSIMLKIGGFREGYEGVHEHDLLLRFTDVTQKVGHIDKILYHWREINLKAEGKESNSIGDKAMINSINESLRRKGLNGTASMIAYGRYQVEIDPPEELLVSIIIPTKDKTDLLRDCLESIYKLSMYRNFEVIVLNNNSEENETFLFFDEISKKYGCKIIDVPIPFNYAQLNNIGAAKSTGDLLLFLNNDTEVITPDWLERLISMAIQPHVGAVGAKLLFEDGTLQHAGVATDMVGVAWHAFYGWPDNSHECVQVMRNCSAVTGACLMVRKALFDEVEGFDENLRVVYNDVDLCLKLLTKGYLNVWTPHAVLYHYESISRGKLAPEEDMNYYLDKWKELLEQGDAYDYHKITHTRSLSTCLSNIQDRSIVVWGAGSGGVKTYQSVTEKGYKINGFVDSNQAKWDNKLFDLSIDNPMLLNVSINKPFVLIGSQFSYEISKQLESMGFKRYQDFIESIT